MFCMIEVAFDNLKEAKKVINELLKYKLIASSQIVKSKSCWSWNHKIEKHKEYLVFLKTKKSLQEQIFKIVREIHNYECFEFAIFNLESCNKDYLKWLEDETK